MESIVNAVWKGGLMIILSYCWVIKIPWAEYGVSSIYSWHITWKLHQMTEISLQNANSKPEITAVITNKTALCITKHTPNIEIRELCNPEPEI